MRALMLAALAALTVATGALAADKSHRLVLQVSSADPAVMNLALNNVVNVAQAYTAKGESIEIEIVAYGPGLTMLRDDTSPVKARLKSIHDSIPGVVFSACEVTRANASKAEGKDVKIVAESRSVPAGVVRLMELQEQGWSYAKP